jgi:glycosyltransferase involved in cell wall biosynthesis
MESALGFRRRILAGATLQTDLLESYVAALFTVSDPKMQYVLFSELAYWELKWPNAVSSVYFRERKKLLDVIAHRLLPDRIPELDKPCFFPKGRKPERVAVLSFAFRGSMYAAARLQEGWQRNSRGKAVRPCFWWRHPLFWKTIRCRTCLGICPTSSMTVWRSRRSMILLKIRTYPLQQTEKKIESMLDELEAFGPDLILDAADDHSVLCRFLIGRYPVFQVPMRTGAGSSSYFDKYLCANLSQMLEVNDQYHCFQRRELVSYMPGFTDCPEPKHKYSREECFGKDAFVLVTVGTRLTTELNKDFVKAICDVVQARNMIWILVGGNLPTWIVDVGKSLFDSGKLIDYGPEKDLPALYDICDIYLNPDRKGGGISVLWAMSRGLPVVMRRVPSDGLYWLGSENAIEAGLTELCEYIEALYDDKARYEEVSGKMRRRAALFTLKNCVDSIARIYESGETE